MASASRLVSTAPALAEAREYAFLATDFASVRRMIHARAGINLGEHKREMVYSRLSRRLRALGRDDFSGYLEMLARDPDHPEWQEFVNALTTNLTAFFREPHHFTILANFVRNREGALSIWCCAASSGEEPYSIAMTLIETLGLARARQARILATDVDTHMLARVQAGVYSDERIAKLAPERVKRFFLKGAGACAGQVRVRPELAAMVNVAPLNLLASDWPGQVSQASQGGFDAIFCRNVMIYFDKPTQGQILSRLAPLLKPDGLLFAGHSENFTYVTRDFRLRGQTVYERTGVTG